jgi:hypothetical protein
MGELTARSLLGPLALALLELDVITYQHRLAWCHDGLPLQFLLFALPLGALVSSGLASPCLRNVGLFRILQGILLLMALYGIGIAAIAMTGMSVLRCG